MNRPAENTENSIAPLPDWLRSRWVDVALALLILGLGLYVRLVDLGVQSFDPDELLHFFAAESLNEHGDMTLPGGLRYARAGWFTETVAASFRLFGPTEAAARLPGALFGAAVVPLVYWVAVTWFGRAAAVFAALAVALVPLNVVHSRRARMYAPLQFFFLFGVFAFYQGLIEKPRRAAAWLLAATAALVAGYSTHVLTSLFAPIAAAYTAAVAGMVGWRQGPAEALRSRYVWIASLLIIGGVVAFLMNPWIADAVATLRGEAMWGAPRLSGSVYLNVLRRAWMFPVGALLIAGTAITLIDRNRAAIYTLVVLGCCLAFLGTAEVQQPRYMVHLFPLIALTASIGFSWIVDRQTAAAVASFSRPHLERVNGLLSARGIRTVALLLVGGLWLLPAAGWARQSLYAARTTEVQDFGSPLRPSWRAACDFVVARDRNAILIATDPLAVLKYCGRIDYGVDGDSWIGSRQYPRAEEWQALAGKTRPGSEYVDPYSGASMILTLDDLIAVLDAHPQAWFIAERGRFLAPRYPEGGTRRELPRHLRGLAPEVHDYVVRSFQRHDAVGDGSVFVFSRADESRTKTP